MGRTKDDFMELRYRVELDEDQLQQIPKEVREGLTFTRIDAANFKEIYKKDVLWNTANENMIHWLKVKQEQEARIRIENR